jgi:hypothetical protein
MPTAVLPGNKPYMVSYIKRSIRYLQYLSERGATTQGSEKSYNVTWFITLNLITIRNCSSCILQFTYFYVPGKKLINFVYIVY